MHFVPFIVPFIGIYKTRKKYDNKNMARHALPYRLKLRGEFWYYKLLSWDSWKATGQKSKTKASNIATLALKENKEDPSAGRLLSDFLEPYFDYDRCPHIQRILMDKGRYSKDWAQAQRSRIQRYLLPDTISRIRIKTLQSGDIEDWKNRLRKSGVSPRTVNATVLALKTALQEGLHRGEIKNNPASGVGIVAESPAETGIFTLEEMRRILFDEPDVWGPKKRLNGAPCSKNDWKRAHVFFLLCAVTGERPAAILAIRWRDLEGDILTFTTTKTGKMRSIPLIQQAVQAVESLGRKSPDALIFSYEDDSPIGKRFYLDRFDNMMERTGFPKLDADGRKRVPYSFKHSFITHLLDGGADEMLVREYVGHSHGTGYGRRLTAVQSRYKHRQITRLRELLPEIERLYRTNVTLPQM